MTNKIDERPTLTYTCTKCKRKFNSVNPYQLSQFDKDKEKKNPKWICDKCAQGVWRIN